MHTQHDKSEMLFTFKKMILSQISVHSEGLEQKEKGQITFCRSVFLRTVLCPVSVGLLTQTKVIYYSLLYLLLHAKSNLLHSLLYYFPLHSTKLVLASFLLRIQTLHVRL